MTKTVINQDQSVVLYNAEKQEIVGIFKTQGLTARYIFPLIGSTRTRRICDTLKLKTRICNSDLGFKVALRFAKNEQLEILGDKDYVILNGYKEPNKIFMAGYNDSAMNMNRKSSLKNSF